MSSENQKSGDDKKDEELQLNQVHSANKWENADLGDDSRKQKFLRLMGASKKDHHGKIVIGDHDKAHERSKEETEEIAEELEEQYNEALHHRKVSGYKGHSGLGFCDEQQKEAETSQETKVTSTESDQENKNSDKEKLPEKHKIEEDKSNKEDKEDKGEKEDEPSDPKKKKFMMNFVKASS